MTVNALRVKTRRRRQMGKRIPSVAPRRWTDLYVSSVLVKVRCPQRENENAAWETGGGGERRVK